MVLYKFFPGTNGRMQIIGILKSIIVLFACLLVILCGLLVADSDLGNSREYIWWGTVTISLFLLCSMFLYIGYYSSHKQFHKSTIESLSSSGEAILVSDHEGNIVFDTAAFRNLISGVKENELLDFNILSSLDSKVREKSLNDFNVLKKSSLSGLKSSQEIEFNSLGGHTNCWQISVEAFSASPPQSLWTVIDVTDQRAVEMNRLKDYQLTADLLDGLPVGFFSANKDGVFKYVNRTLAEWLSIQYPAEENHAKYSLADFIQINEDPNCQPDIEMDPSGMHGGLRLKNREGEEFSVFLIQSQHEDQNNEFVYSRSIVLREPFLPVIDDGSGGSLIRRLPWLFSDSPVGIVFLDLQGTVVDCNRSFLKILGLHHDGVVGWPISERISKEDRESVDAALSKVVMKIMRATLLEVKFPAGGEREATTDFYVSRLENNDSEVIGLVGHVIDTSEQKHLEVQFNHAQKMQAVGELAGGVAHEFNNLLTVMGGFCDLLLERHPAGDPDFSDISQVKQNVERAAKLVSKLLASSRRQTWQPKIFSVTDALNESKGLLRPLIGENIEITLTHGADVGLIRADYNQFEQVIMNLGVNARDAMPGGGTISISSKLVSVEKSVQRGHDVIPAGEYIRLDVADTGSGIAQENIARVWDPFFSTKEVGEGTGLGLSMVYGIIRKSRGYIFVDSALGAGTTFEIYLPAFSAAEVSATGGKVSKVGALEVVEDEDLSGEATILLVEDEDAVRVFGSKALTNKGYRVLEAEDGEMALDVINEYNMPIDLVITDVMMPGMDGYTLVRLVQEELPEIKVILMSGYAEDIIPGEVESDDRINFLSKPFSLRELAGKVKKVLEE
ncbi:MAG: response regulator [Pseudomonadota bacterium]|nr:response regulator [Pseudomonadota bacterium]